MHLNMSYTVRNPNEAYFWLDYIRATADIGWADDGG